MRRTSDYRARLVMVGVVAAMVFGGGTSVRADFIFGPATNLEAVNSNSYDSGASVSSDGLELYFSSYRDGGLGASDIWVSKRPTKDADWGEPVNLGPSVNRGGADGAPSLTGDDLELYFSSRRSGGYGGGDIWVSRRETKYSPWDQPVHLESPANDSMNLWSVSVSPDGLELYATTANGGSASMDLWVIRRESKDAPWGAPENLYINSADRDMCQALTPDGLGLVFSSGRGQMNQDTWNFDLWFSRRDSKQDPWGTPVKLGPSINSPYSDMASCISADGRMFYFWDRESEGTRPGGKGQRDLWQAPIIPIVDFDGDGQANSNDLSILMQNWGLDEALCDIGPMPWGDGIVNAEDLMVLAEYVPEIRSPRAEAVDVPRDASLSWIGSPLADTYDVYFGTSFEDVNAADRDDPRDMLISQGQHATTYQPNGLLEFGRTYYWRVDEVSASPGSTVYGGCVLEFTTELHGYPLGNATATSNAISAAGEGPENTTNGSGLDAADRHSIAAGDMWLGVPDGTDPVYIQYEFDNVYRLHEMLVWNYNVQFELALGFGLKDVTVEYSENGADWTALDNVQFAQATARSDYAANTTVDFGGVAAKCVRLTVNSGWSMLGQFGLSEVRFFHIPTRAWKPQPADGETGVYNDAILNWHAGRQAALHEVYLSTDRQAVVDGTALIDTVTESSYQPSALDPGQTYYWKINEVNEAEAITSWEGDVWELTTIQ